MRLALPFPRNSSGFIAAFQKWMLRPLSSPSGYPPDLGNMGLPADGGPFSRFTFLTTAAFERRRNAADLSSQNYRSSCAPAAPPESPALDIGHLERCGDLFVTTGVATARRDRWSTVVGRPRSFLPDHDRPSHGRAA